jgi:hypothetical protein
MKTNLKDFSEFKGLDMSIPEADLTTMAQIGAQVTSKDTYSTVRLALEREDAGYFDKKFTIFLQGSYGNDTNIFKESDVDVITRLDSIFTYDINNLPDDQKAAFQAVHPAAVYTHKHFREHVLEVLTDRFGDDVVPGTKAVMIKPFHNRRKTDVLIATQHRKYSSYYCLGNETQITGISFHKLDGTRVVNYPRQHRENLVKKNQATSEWFKHIIRIWKNARQQMIDAKMIEASVAPSYYLEGLLYNAPNNLYGKSYENTIVNVLNWVLEADRSSFLCANEQYPLLDGNADVTWNSQNCDAYLCGLVELWHSW